jgi:hypothetical protein
MFCEYPQGYYTLCTRPLHAWRQCADSSLSSSTEVGWLSMTVSSLLNNSVWKVKTLTSGVDDCYVKPDIPNQIFNITSAVRFTALVMLKI